MIARIESLISRFDLYRDRPLEDLHNAEYRISEYQSRLGVPFELQAELDAKLAELDAINRALAATESQTAEGADPNPDPDAVGAGGQPAELPAVFARLSALEDDPTDDVGTPSPDDERDE